MWPSIDWTGAAQFSVERSKDALSVSETPFDHVLEVSMVMRPVVPAGSVWVRVAVWEGCPGDAGME